jgi:hypothetical protein
LPKLKKDAYKSILKFYVCNFNEILSLENALYSCNPDNKDIDASIVKQIIISG